MNQRLRTMYSHLSVHATADLEHEAAVELLLLVMMSDHHVSDDELDEIRHISDDSGWETDTFSFDQYLGTAMAKVRTAKALDSAQADSLRSSLAKVAGVPTDADGLDVDALEKTLATSKPKFLYVIPNFGNPNGALMSLERRQRLLQLQRQLRHQLQKR